MALTLTASPSIPALVPSDYVPSLSVSALDTVPDVEFGSQVTVTVTTILGDATTLNEGTDYSYNSVSDEVFFYYPVVNTDTIQFSITPDYSTTDLSTQFSDLGVAPAEGSNLRDKQLLQMARDLDARILALGGQASGGGGAGVSSLVVGSSSYTGTIQLFAGTGLSFIEGASSFQINLDQSIVDAPSNISSLTTSVTTLDGDVSTLTTTVGNIRQVPDASSATIGHVLTVNNSNEPAWQAATGGSGSGATVINDLDDVVLTTLADGDILVASGGDFVNQAPSFLTSGDVGTVAVDNDYNSLDNLPTIPTTTGTWGLTTDRANVTFNAPVSETLASGYVWRWTGSQFKPAQLDIADVNTAGNQPLVDLMAGTTEAAPSYVSGDASKVLTVSSGGTGLEWAAAASGSGPRIWSCYFDRSDSASNAHAVFGSTTTWEADYLGDESNAIVDQFGSNQITVGSSIGSYSNGEFSITETGTYKVTWTMSVGSRNVNGSETSASDLSLLRNGGGSPDASDEVLRRSLMQHKFDDAGGTLADDGYIQYSHSSLIELDAGDDIFLWLSDDTTSIVAPVVGSWMIEKVG